MSYRTKRSQNPYLRAAPRLEPSREYNTLRKYRYYNGDLANSLLRTQSSLSRDSYLGRRSSVERDADHKRRRLETRVQELSVELRSKDNQLQSLYQRTQRLLRTHRQREQQWLQEKQALLKQLAQPQQSLPIKIFDSDDYLK